MGSASDGADALRLDRQMCFPLYAASNLVTRLYRPILAEFGLTYPQYLVMLALWESAPRTVSALGDQLHLDSGTLTPLLKRMESAGLVTRRRDAEDERRVRIALTPKGEAMKADALSIPARLAANSAITPGQVDAVCTAVRDLMATLIQPAGRTPGD